MTTLPRLIGASLLLLLAACEPMVHVDATADVPARYAGVVIRVEQVWFNQDAAAVAEDDTWLKFPLDDAETIDLVDLTGGEIARIADELDVPVGTYRQVRVLLASQDGEVTWFDEDGEEQVSPLQILNAEQGIGIEIELEVEEELSGSTALLLFDAGRDLTQFTYSGATGFLLNSTLQAFDVDEVGTIRGTLNLSLLGDAPGTGRHDVQVTAQRLDEAADRWIITGSASVSQSGAFVLYPLPLEVDGDPAQYDLVIHGPGIGTIIVQEVPVSAGAPDTAAAVALGSLVPIAADSYEADIRADDPVAPRGARIGFYQTLPGEDEPHLIGMSTVDPLRGRFAQPVALSRAATISYRTHGSNAPLVDGTPEEGAARYAVAALSSRFGNGNFAGTTLRPATPVSDTAMFSVPAIAVQAPAVAGTISATVTVENPGQYDSGALFITQEGAIVTVVPLDELLQQQLGSAFIDVTPVPAGTPSATLQRGLYYVEAWTWDSADPEDTFTRHAGAGAVDLRAAATASAAVTVR